MSRRRDLEAFANVPVWQAVLTQIAPAVASQMITLVYNLADTFFVGQIGNPYMVAAVSLVSPWFNLLTALGNLFGLGGGSLISRLLGRNDHEDIKNVSAFSIWGGAAVTLLFSLLTFLFREPLLNFLGASPDTYGYAESYLNWVVLGGVPTMLSPTMGHLLRSEGHARPASTGMMFGGILNVVLDPVLIFGFHLDVAGVAIATVISNAISASLVLYFLMHEKSEVHLDLKKLGFNRADLKRILRIGVPAGIQSMVFSISNVIIQSVLNGFGTNAVAGSAVALTYENLGYFMISAFSQTSVTFTSQNFGAGQYRRCIKIFHLCFLFSVISDMILCWTFYFGRVPFVAIFTDNPDVAKYAYMRMMIVLLVHFLISTYESGGAALRGMGYSMTPAVLTVFGTCVLRLLWAYTVCRIWPRFEVLMLVYPISWIITGSSVQIAYFSIRRKAFRTHHAISQMGR